MPRYTKWLFSLILLLLVGGLLYRTSRINRIAHAAAVLDVFPSNPRLSFRGILSDGNAADTSIAYIQTTFEASRGAYSTTSGQLVNGDEVFIGSNRYGVSITSVALPDNQIPLSGLLQSSDIAAGTMVYSPMSGTLKLTYTPQAGQTDGSFRFLIPAASNTAAANDGIPDSGAYDFNNAVITCPSPDGNYTSWTATADSAATSGVVQGKNYYHSFTCNYTGLSTADPLEFIITGLINPAPANYIKELQVNRTIGSMDVMNVSGTQYSGSGAVVSTSSSFVGYGSSVTMRVKVLPQLTFILNGIGNGQAVCSGIQTNVATSGVLVPFGSISNTNFIDAAQKLNVTTNAANGYVVTVIANDQMGLDGQSCPGDGDIVTCIPGYGSTTTASDWTVNDGRGFGYTLNVVDGDDYLNNGLPNVHTSFTATDGWRAFADKANGDQPIQIINNLRSTNGDEIDICYRIMSSASNMPGDYRSTLTYTVTASF